MTDSEVTPNFKSPKPLKKHKGLRSTGAKQRREAKAVAAFSQALQERSGGRCEVCGHWGHHPHHKCPADRDRGVHDPARGLWVCARCHDAIHHHVALAYQRGWMIRDGVTDQ